MQNNPFGNIFSQLQSAAGANMAAPPGQNTSGVPNTSLAGNQWNNATLMGAMQSVLARGSSSMPNVPAGVLGSMPGSMPGVASQNMWNNKPPGSAGNESTPDMSIFRQFQIPQNQQMQQNTPTSLTSMPALRPVSSTGAAPIASSIQAPAASWNNPTAPAASLGGLQAPAGTWNNPAQMASTMAWNNPAMTPNAGAAGQGMNNPLLGGLLQAFMAPQMPVQPQQPNPMANLLPMMMLAGMMPGMGAQTPNLDPNMTKQLVMQLVGQLQQSGELSKDDPLQAMLQQSGLGQQAGQSNATAGDVASVSSDITPQVEADENDEIATLSTTKLGKKGKPGPKSSRKGPPAKKSAEIDKSTNFETTTPVRSSRVKNTDVESGISSQSKIKVELDEADNDDVGSSLPKSSQSLRNKPSKGSSKVPEIVSLDSDDDEEEDFTPRKSNLLEEKKKGKGKGKAPPQSKTAPKSKKAAVKPGPKSKQETVPIVRSSVPEPVKRIKIEDTVDDDDEPEDIKFSPPRPVKGPPVSRKSDSSEAGMSTVARVKSEDSGDVKPFRIPPGVHLRKCEVKLTRVNLKRDACGRFILPREERTPKPVVSSYRRELPKTPSKSDLMLSGKRSSPGAARDDSELPNVKLLPNMNGTTAPSLRTLYIGHQNGNMQWLILIGWERSRCFCQCAFCPVLSETPKAILSHIRSEHPDLTFALTKMKQPTGKFLYIYCRHCDFVALDVTINWLHFEVYHNVSDILEGTARPRIDEFAPAKIEVQHGIENIMETQQSYMCYDCQLISEDSKQLAIHVLQSHIDTVHYNGCFVKLLSLRRPLKSDNVQYRRIISDDEFAEFRQEAFICMMCDYIAHCPYLALSHNLNTHQSKRILFECMEKGCKFNCISETAMMQHLSSRHKLKTDLGCSTTLLEFSKGNYVECVIEGNRKTSKEPTLQRCNAPAVPNNNGASVSPVTFTSDEGSENGGDENGKAPKKKKSPGKDSNSWKKVLDDDDDESNEQENGEDSAAGDDGKLPDDIKITINPPSPDERAESPMSDASEGTIVEEDETDSKKETEASETNEAVEDAEQPTPEPAAAAEDADKNQQISEDGKETSKDPQENTDDKNAGTSDFLSDIPLEPCCLSTDIYLPVPADEICTFDAEAPSNGPGSEGQTTEAAPQLNTPEKTYP